MILSASKPSQTCPWSRSQKCSKPRWELRLRRARFGAFSTVTPSPSKKPRTQPSRTGPTSPPPAAWRELAPRLDPDKLVFIDETGCPYRKSNPAASRRRTRVVWPSSEYAPGTAPFPARKSAIIKLTHLFLQRPAFWPSSLIFDMNGEAKTASTKHSSPDHSSSLGASVTSSTRIRFSVHTPRRKSRSAVSISPATKSSGTPSIAAS